MKELPILFKSEMVKAILENRKTMTRRMVKPQPIDNEEIDGNFYEGNSRGFVRKDILHNWQENFIRKFSPWQSGDKLWVRETFRMIHHYGFNYQLYQYKDGCTTAHCKIVDPDQIIPISSWKPSIHMPYKISRIFLDVVDVRIERLHDISEEDIIAEGVQIPIYEGKRYFVLGEDNSALSFMPKDWLLDEPFTSYQILFAHWAELWCHINGRESWDANPWVYVIKFKRGGRP